MSRDRADAAARRAADDRRAPPRQPSAVGRRPRPAGAGAHLARRPRPADPLRYVERPWPLSAYQNVYANEPGSAEMPSAGRPFTPDVITRLVAKGVGVVPLVLHTGVASLEADELPYPERVRVPAATAEQVNATQPPAGGSSPSAPPWCVALETAVGDDGRVARLRRLDRRRGHAGARRPCGRRPADRLARAGGLAPADAGGGGRSTAARSARTRPAWRLATCGTSSATST